MTTQALPTRLSCEPRIENWIDDSDPHYDFRAGYQVRFRSSEGWHDAYYGRSDEVTAWLAQRGYAHVLCTSRRHILAGRYERA